MRETVSNTYNNQHMNKTLEKTVPNKIKYNIGTQNIQVNTKRLNSYIHQDKTLTFRNTAIISECKLFRGSLSFTVFLF